MDLSSKKRIAADILNVGIDRVWIDPNKLEDVQKALSRQDIKDLIDKGIIRSKQIKGQSRVLARYKQLQRLKGRRRGIGNRKGTKKARNNKKEKWMIKIRAIRRLIKQLKSENKIDRSTYRIIYNKSKSGAFRNKRHILTYLKETGILKE
ncbi:50S ribosomal protein L19e [Nanobdella aerobiophila]|uniref:Large ribosomal subunit protein eL19 n=1 Tax=Nanobdella aerobiophila TaxID=2586965 RepID=A0A915WT21_9ARCH|nr:50S ribosomal protein L19e [Nanobdella aerobiophila]BBL45895.1 50S ribosomal protein L19e [Nanobdella aerobiophila]